MKHLASPERVNWATALRLTHASFETPCGAYGHFKITRYLLRVTKDSRYGDSMERVLYNTILGAWPIQADGTSFYYSDYAETGKKVWYRTKVAVLLRNFPATRGGLPHQHIFAFRGWCVRKSLHSVPRAME